MPKIIALTGAKGCGKDTTATILRNTFDNGNTKVMSIAFADPIKNEVMRIFGLSDVYEYDNFKRSKILPNYSGAGVIEGRHVVREIGMLMRRYNINQFVQYVDENFEMWPDVIWVVTDLRFDNELIHLQNLGAKIVKIKRKMIETIDTHITERGFDDSICDLVIENKHTLEDFAEEVKSIFNNKLKEWNWI